MIHLTAAGPSAGRGNFPPPPDDRTHMDCNSARAALSAAMDGEEPPAGGGGSADAQAAESHARGCDACRRWCDAVERIDRAARLEPAPEPAEDPAPAVLAAVRLPRAGRRIRLLRAALGATALVQIGLGLAGLVDAVGVSMHGAAMHATGHMSHELVAFNVAFGVALLVVAARVDRARAQVPMLTVFVAVLAAVSVADLASGQVGWVRLATHAPIVVGLVLAVCAARVPVAPAGPGSPGSAGGGRSAWAWPSVEQVLHRADGPPPSPAADAREERRAA